MSIDFLNSAEPLKIKGNKEQIRIPFNCIVLFHFPHFRDSGFSKPMPRDFPGGPVVKSLPYNAGDAGSIPGQGTKIPHATGN